MADQTHDLAGDVHGVEVHGLHALVGGLQPNARLFFVEPLDGRLVVNHGDDGFAVVGGLLAAHDDQITLVDAVLDHAVPDYEMH